MMRHGDESHPHVALPAVEDLVDAEALSGREQVPGADDDAVALVPLDPAHGRRGAHLEDDLGGKR